MTRICNRATIGPLNATLKSDVRREMTDTQTLSQAGKFEVKAAAADHFAWLRTRLALERTIMSWLRTATALIGFGFAIVQYLNHLEQTPGAHPAYLPDAPRLLGLALIGCGVLALLVSVWQYRWGSVTCGVDPMLPSPA